MVSPELERELPKLGLEPIDEDIGFAAFERALASGAVNLAIAGVSWSTFRAAHGVGTRRAFLESLSDDEAGRQVVERRVLSPGPPVPPGADHSDEASVTRLTNYLRAELASVLRLPDPESVDTDLGFFQMGLDSLMAVELTARLVRQLGIDLPQTTLFNYSTINALAQHLAVAAKCCASALIVE